MNNTYMPYYQYKIRSARSTPVGCCTIVNTGSNLCNLGPTGPKTFVIPHPEPEHEGKMLRHACVEAPTRGTNIYEYQIEVKEDNGTTKIALPSYFKHLNDDPKVLITPHNVQCRFYGAVNKELTHVNVTTEKAGIFNVMVSGIRKDPTAVAYSSTAYIDKPIALEDIPE